MEYTVIKLKAMKSGTKMAFIHEGKVKRGYGRLIERYLTAAGINPHVLTENWVNIIDIEEFRTLKEAKKSIEDYEGGE